MRLCGSIPGVYRYAEPQDDSDTLCQKLTGIFEISSRSCSVPIKLGLTGIRFRKDNPDIIQFPIDSTNFGEYSQWVYLDNIENLEQNMKVVVNSELDENQHACIKIINNEIKAIER